MIDIGTSAIRMAIAEIDPGGQFRTLERLIQAVNLGKDSFSRGSISRTTTEECVRVLRSYRAKLNEYLITDPDSIRVVATSAVREASNRVSFMDRIYAATGFLVEAIDEAEISRVTYLGIQPLIKAEAALEAATTIVTEVGGGSTEVLILRRDSVAHSHTYRLGSLRLRETLDTYRAPRSSERRIMESHIDRTIDAMREFVPVSGTVALLALGGDVRFAASQLIQGWDPDALTQIPVDDLEKFTDSLLSLSEDQLVQKYHLTLPDAESVGPALLAYVRLAREFQLQHVLVTSFTLRDALLAEMANQTDWSEDLQQQILQSASDLARRFDYDESHARHVAALAQRLFHELQDEHQLDTRWELILQVAAQVHEIGQFINNRSYHKHTMYLVNNSELFGLGPDDIHRVALVARYHRRAAPKPSHAAFQELDRDDRIAVSRMAAILRVADALDHSRSQRITRFNCERDEGRLVITVSGVDDLSLEQLELRQKGSLFEDSYGIDVLLRKAGIDADGA